MILYGIRHKPSGEFMPTRMNKGYTGWSYWTVGNLEDPPYDRNPRLFFTLASAQAALTMWLQGVWKRDQGERYDWEGTPEGYDQMTVDTPAAPRLRADMEIVSFDLEERPSQPRL